MEAQLPLEGLFLHLVHSGFPLSVRDYEDALTALQRGHGSLRRDHLQWLCEMLWVRTEEERIRLVRLFREFPQPTPKAIETLTGTRTDAQSAETAPAAEASEATPPGEPQTDATAREAPLPQFAAPEETGGVGLPKAAVPTSALQPYVLTPRLPVSLRTLIVTWRRFRLARRAGPKVELDIDATVAEKSRCGTLVEPVLVPARRNQARLLVLIDASPSMAPWRNMGQSIADSLGRSLLGHSAVHYFHNDPGEMLFETDRMTRPRTFQQVAREHVDCTLLVVGDAGAARDHNDRDRVRAAKEFIAAALAVSWWPIAWVNPMPQSRWTGTSAARIAGIPGVAMFELTEDGVVQAIDYLRGKCQR